MTANKGFLRNTAVMFAAMFISKALGAVLKIPLGNILGGEGMGYFTTAYSIFTPVLSFVCAGIPTVLTRSVAGYAAAGEYRSVRNVRRCSLLLALAAGIAGSALIFAAAVPFVCVIANSPESLPAVLIIAPATVFCSITAVYRGYYEGLSDTLPTALSQVIESFVRAGVGVGLSYYVYVNGVRFFGSQSAALPYSAAAAILGVTVSEICGTLFMLVRSRRRSDSYRDSGEKMTGAEILAVCREITVKALPISLGAAASNLISLADMLTISNCIDLSASIFDGYWASDTLLSEIRSNFSGVGNFMYGCYAGIIMSVYMLTSSVSGVIARCELPRLTYAAEKGSVTDLGREIKLLIKGTASVTAPVSALMAVLSEPVLQVLYPARTAEVAVSAVPLTLLSAGGLVPALLGSVCMIFNAYGDFGFPIKVTLIGGAVKLVFNVMFIAVPQMNISGAAISSVLSCAVCLVYSVRTLKKRFGISTGCIRYSIPSVFAGLGGGVGAYLFFRGLEAHAGTLAALAVSATAGAVIYALMLFIYDSSDCAAVIRLLRKKRV
ncbi:MAG: polysaccharide biosynthesis C-terminal domain-containing protein [Ruminiclostridium sp.]|nr:polysaccharide biosynthesis C-terminal domain-containing protein [Ruminiclostridium sp.]